MMTAETKAVSRMQCGLCMFVCVEVIRRLAYLTEVMVVATSGDR